MKKVCQPATFQPLEVNGQLVPFWKHPISHCLEPGGHAGGRTFRAQKPQLEIPGLEGKLPKRRVSMQATVDP